MPAFVASFLLQKCNVFCCSKRGQDSIALLEKKFLHPPMKRRISRIDSNLQAMDDSVST